MTESDYLSAWHMQSPDLGARRAYVVSELRRLASEGVPFLAKVLTSEPIACELALAALGSPREVFNGPKLYHLRLADGATPPSVDPHGRRLPPNEAGSVLIAKVGNAGGDLPPSSPESVTASFTGPNRQRLMRDGRAYRVAKITREPESFDLHEAVAILRQWGAGVRGQQYLNRNDQARRIDTWLVEEMSDAQVQERRDAQRDREREAAREARAQQPQQAKR